MEYETGVEKKIRIETGGRAALVRASGLDPDNPNRPGLTSWTQTAAAADLLCRDIIDQAVFVTGSRLSEVMVDEFRRLVGDRLKGRDVIIFHPVAHSTREETRVLQELDREYRWKQVLDIGDETQIKRIERANERILSKELRDRLTLVSGESILLISPTFNYKVERDILTLAERAVEMVRNSPEREAILRMNGIINPVDALPFGGQILDLITLLGPTKIFVQALLERILINKSKK